MAAAASERTVTHARVIEMTGLHSFDASRLLQHLVREGFLESHNPGRGAVYCLPGASLPRPEEVFGEGSASIGSSSAHLAASSAHLTGRSAYSAGQLGLADSEKTIAEQRDDAGRLLSPQLDAPIVDSLDSLTPEFRQHLEKLAEIPRLRAKVAPEIMRMAILAVCTDHYITGTCIAALVARDPDALRQQHLKPLANERRLRMAFPTAPTHAMQAYRANEE